MEGENQKPSVISETKIILMTYKIVIGTWIHAEEPVKLQKKEVCLYGSGKISLKWTWVNIEAMAALWLQVTKMAGVPPPHRM